MLPSRRRPRRPDAPQADTVQIVQGLRRIVKALHSYSQDVYRTYALTAPQLWALKTLQREGPMPAGRLAQALAVHQSSLSLLVDRLEERGLVQRIRTATDRRVVRLALTRRGVALAAMAPQPAQGRLLHALQVMSPWAARYCSTEFCRNRPGIRKNGETAFGSPSAVRRDSKPSSISFEA